MRGYKTLWLFFCLFFTGFATAQAVHDVKGHVADEENKPVPFALVSIPAYDLWSTANEKGEFVIKNVPAGKTAVQVEYLDYTRRVFEINVSADTTYSFHLHKYNLTLDEVVVTARKSQYLKTSFVIDRKALDHFQMLNVSDATALLPGGKTNTNLHLATSSIQNIAVNGKGSEMGRAIFGVGVEVDGVRLSNNAVPGSDMEGSDTRNIASTNIESIEIITGIPSVEDGDATNGIVKIKTRKGKSPYIMDMMTKPNSKQVSLSKGFGLGAHSGVLNVNIEHTRSVSNIASPYTSYERNGLSLNYSNTYNKKRNQPLFFNFGVSGNAGGYNSKSDPDLFVNTYSAAKDNALRSNVSAKWLLNKKWITNIEVSSNINYSNKQYKSSSNKSSSSSVAAIHATDEGYHIGETYDQNPDAAILLLAPGYWYELQYEDNRLINYAAKIKAGWSHKYGAADNHFLLGGEYTGSGNLGRGTYYDDIRYTPTWREYRYDKESSLNNYSVYAEDRLHIPFAISHLRLVAGLRSDITAVNQSAYGTVSNLSPRFNLQYSFWENDNHKAVSELSVKIGWGKMAKLPSFSMLYPRTEYRDILTFAPGTTSSGEVFYAFYTQPTTRLFNPGLKWQSNVQQEISVSMNIRGNKILIIAAQDKTSNPYSGSPVYQPFTYKFTDQSNLSNSNIPIADRIYTVDKITGIVTVTDKTGAHPAETLSYREYTAFQANDKPVNGSPVMRRRISWVIDFKQINALKTSFRVDGNYYYYKGIEETMIQSIPNTTVLMADGNPYKYIGFYPGGAVYANGSVSKSINMNFTAITHIPAIRLIFSARIEASLYDFSRNLSEYSKGSRGFVIDSRDANIPSTSKAGIYDGDQFVAVYPEYYISLDDMNTPVPFAEKFLWAKDNDVALYNELAKMVIKTNYNYSFNKNYVSPYLSANISITKEIGNIASVSFNATNFFNNMATIRNSGPGTTSSLFRDTSPIPAFYYGLSLQLKL